MKIENKKVLITGVTGFIGLHLAGLCVERGFDVVAFDCYNPNSHWGWLEDSEYKNEMKVILGDVRDYDSVSKSMRGCDVVFHMAVLIGIPYSYISPMAYIRTNVEGAYNVLEAAKNLNVDRGYSWPQQLVPIDGNIPFRVLMGSCFNFPG